VSVVGVSGEYVEVTTITEGVGVSLFVVGGVWVIVEVTSTMLGEAVVVGVVSMIVVDGGIEMEETLVVVGIVVVGVASGVELEVEVSVTTTVVVGEVVKLVEVVMRVVTTTESVDALKLAVSDSVSHRLIWDFPINTCRRHDCCGSFLACLGPECRPAAARGRTGSDSIQQG
jgi:hypothetical protein